MKEDRRLFHILPKRFEIIDHWLIHYCPLKKVNPQTSSVFLYFLEENAKRVRASGNYPVLLMDLRHAVITHDKEVIRVLSEGLYGSYICAIAAYGLPYTLNRAVFSVTLREAKKIPGRFFESRQDAEVWLRVVVENIKKSSQSLKPSPAY